MAKALGARRFVLFREKMPWWVRSVAQQALCLLFRHDPVRDQCNRPDHDFCLWCQKSMPGRARRET